MKERTNYSSASSTHVKLQSQHQMHIAYKFNSN